MTIRAVQAPTDRPNQQEQLNSLTKQTDIVNNN